MQLSMKGFNEETAQAKRAECIVRLRIRENDVKSQMWRLMTDNSFEAVTNVEGEVSKIFEDLDSMIIELFDTIQGVRTRKPEDASSKRGDVDKGDDLEDDDSGSFDSELVKSF